MEAKYIRNYLNSYLVLSGQKGDKNYESKIIEENNIKGFLQVQTNYINQEFNYMYDISSKQNLKEIMEKKKFKKDDVVKLVNGLIEITNEIKEYLLEVDNIVLDSEYIYMDFAGNIEYCYYPYNGKDFFDELRKLFEQILSNIEHNDKETVLLTYGIYQKILENKIELSFMEVEEKEEVKEVREKEPVYEIKEEVSIKKKDDKITIAIVLFLIVSMLLIDKIPLIIRIAVIFGAAYVIYGKINKQIKKEDEDTQINNIIYVEEESEEIQSEEVELAYTQLLTKEHLEHPMLKSLEGLVEDIELDKVSIIIGSMSDVCDYIIKDSTVSRMHAKYENKEGRHYIKDMNSKNGTYVNEKLLAPNEVVEIFSGDVIIISKYKYSFMI